MTAVRQLAADDPFRDRKPLWSEDAEQAVLGAMLLDDDAIALAIERAHESMFFREAHQRIFRAIRALYRAGTALDPLTLANELEREGSLVAAGGKDYLGTLLDVVPTAANVEYHLRIVKDKAQRRRLAQLGSELASEAATGSLAPAAMRAAFLELLRREEASASGAGDRFYSATELDALPAAEWIVANAIPQNGIVGAIGAKGQYKTFAMLDLALHVAAGKAWQGRAVTQAPMCYLYAEGPFGAKARVESWCQYHGVARSALPVWFRTTRLPVNNPAAIEALLAAIAALPAVPGLVVIDTLNQNLDGDEDGTGMGGFVRGCAQVRDRLGATVIAVHHTPLGAEDRGRGHSSFDGALDTRLIISRDADRVTIECTHQRNAEDGWSVAAEAIPVAGSLVLRPSALDGGTLKGQRRDCLAVLHSQGTLGYTAWLTATELKPSSFRKARTWLLAKNYVRVEAKKYTASGSGILALGHQGHSEGTHD